MNPVTQLPKDRQKVLIDTGVAIEPAMYNERHGTFERYENCLPGDRCITYFYSGVVGWLPFPEHPKMQGFVAEPERPLRSRDILEPFTDEELEILKTWPRNSNGDYMINMSDREIEDLSSVESKLLARWGGESIQLP